MCSIIALRTESAQFVRDFENVVLSKELNEGNLNIRCHGYLKNEWAPVISRNSSGQLSAQMKYFSLCPPWAKSWPFQFSTYNARMSRPKKNQQPLVEEPLFYDEPRLQEIEWISEVPSFKEAFSRGQTCLVPISDAIESCYFGRQAGSVVRFSHAFENVFYALGIWNDWTDPISGEVFPTFALLTDNPDEFVFENGHDRGLILLHPSDWNRWLCQPMHSSDRIKFMRSQRVAPQWKVKVERPLKQGWQKHSPTPPELNRIEVFRGHKVC